MTASIKQSKTIIVGVAGGSGSGKTYFVEALYKRLGNSICTVVCQDSFYHDQSQKFDYDGGSVNFDHPESIDYRLMAERLAQLKSGRDTRIPIYDFVTHSRREESVPISAKPVILVDGILIFHWPEVRELFDEMIYFDTPEELRYKRRLDRDVRQRGRTAEGVRNQFLRQVKPMHDAYVEPSKKHAHLRVHDVGQFDDVLEKYFQKFSAFSKT